MNDNVTDIKTFKNKKSSENRLVQYAKMTRALQQCYKILRPFFKYRAIFVIGKTIVDIRQEMLTDLREMKKKEE